MNDQYIELFESNVIKTVDHVNRFTEQMKREMEIVGQKQVALTVMVEEIRQRGGQGVAGSFSSELMGVALPGIRVMLNVSVREERRPKNSLTGFKCHIK